MIAPADMTELEEIDWMYSVQINRWLMRPIGVWPISLCLGIVEKLSTVTLALISTFLIGFLLVPCALCTILDKTGDLDAKIKMIGPLSFCVMAAVKYYILVSRSGKISSCIWTIRSDWAQCAAGIMNESKEIMIESAKFGRSLAVFCAAFMYSGGFFYTTVMPLASKRTEIIDNETVRSQAFPIYRGLLDPRTSPSFEIVQLMQCLAGFVIYSVTVGACSLAAVFVTHACGQFKILTAKLDRFVNNSLEKVNAKIREESLGDIVEHHLKILRLLGMGAKRCYRDTDLLHVINIVYIQYFYTVLHRRNSLRRVHKTRLGSLHDRLVPFTWKGRSRFDTDIRHIQQFHKIDCWKAR
ncbi:uncharacterized protein LOC116428001 isoform X3 [Nomia melanderi]|uniref:uncharacterized protein LOC116428001 isoform X3 n=1 Tax=Nomia melanderi TaxID=2448451 RepID=UPI003FCDB73C